MYKNFVFDAYGTLVDISTNEHDMTSWQKMTETLAFYGVNYTPTELKEMYFSSCELQINQGLANFKHPEVDVLEIAKHIFENKGVKATKTLAMHVSQEFRAFTTQKIALYANVVETLTKLRKAGKKIYILSNAQRIYTQTELSRLGILKLFHGIVYSSDHKCQKPDVALFDVLVNKYKLNRKETIMIGNDALADVNGARAAKIDCMWIKTNLTNNTDTPKFAPKYVVNNGDITEVLRLLNKK